MKHNLMFLRKNQKVLGQEKTALERAKKKGLKGLNKPQRLNDDSGKSHHVMAFENKKENILSSDKKELRQIKQPGNEGLSKADIGKISREAKCLRLIGLIK